MASNTLLCGALAVLAGLALFFALRRSKQERPSKSEKAPGNSSWNASKLAWGDRNKKDSVDEEKRPSEVQTPATFSALVLCPASSGIGKVVSSVPIDQGRRIFHGTDSGVYVCEVGNASSSPIKVIPLAAVIQVDVLEEHHLLLVLANHYLYTFSYNPSDPFDPLRYGECGTRKRRVSYFCTGTCLGRTMVCAVVCAVNKVSSVFKVLEPVDQSLYPTRRGLREFKTFYTPCKPTSVHFLRSKLCISCEQSFKIVDLETLLDSDLLDPEDSSLEFALQGAKPISIHRTPNDLLLCYDQFALLVNKNGWRSNEHVIHWRGKPSSFALYYPYVLAFDSTAIEVHNLETGALHQTISGSGLRCLFHDVPPSPTREVYDRENPRSIPWLRNLHELGVLHSLVIFQGDDGSICRLQLADSKV